MKHTKKMWALVLALVMALCLTTAAWATVNPNQVWDIEFEIEKTVVGTGTTPAATFTFELTDPDGHSLSDCGIAVSDDTVTLAANQTRGTTAFAIRVTDPAKFQGTWNRDGNGGYAKTFRLTEKNDGASGWTYDSRSYDIELTYSAAGDLDCTDYATRTFQNVYAPVTTVNVPFTKVVTLGGSREPANQSFALEVFNAASPVDVDVAASVETSGSGTYTGSIVITGTASDIDSFLGRGFYVRERNDGAANWAYSDAVWHVIENNGQINTYPATKHTSANGDYYADGAPAAMSFTNIYTHNVGPIHPDADRTDDAPFVSPKTFDAGIGIYAVSALLSVTGGAWLVGKKHK